MTSRKIISAILFLMGSFCVFALDDITSTPPQVSGPGINQSDVNDAFNKAFSDIKKEIDNINSKPEKLIKSMGTASVFASQGATQRAYGEYKVFCFTLGPMIGLQFPGNPFDIMKDPDGISRKLNEEKDIKLGLSLQAFNARIGINTSKFLLKNLYLGLHFGFMKLDDGKFGLDGASIETFSVGATANYQLFPSIKIANGLLLWRGVNIGSGFIYSGSKIRYSIPLGLFEQKVDSSSTYLTIDPRITADMKIDTFTIPIEVTTAVKLFWFLNIPFGIGLDFGFGKSDMKAGMIADINFRGLPSGVTQTSPGSLSVNAGGAMPPFVANFKLMTGIGFNIGPVILDIPVAFYVFDHGYSIGITLGGMW